MQNAKVLIVDDNEDVLLAARLLLKSQAGIIDVEKDPGKILKHLDNKEYDVIFLDMNFTQDMTSGQEGFYWLKQILQISPHAVVILITSRKKLLILALQ